MRKQPVAIRMPTGKHTNCRAYALFYGLVWITLFQWNNSANVYNSLSTWLVMKSPYTHWRHIEHLFLSVFGEQDNKKSVWMGLVSHYCFWNTSSQLFWPFQAHCNLLTPRYLQSRTESQCGGECFSAVTTIRTSAPTWWHHGVCCRLN